MQKDMVSDYLNGSRPITIRPDATDLSRTCATGAAGKLTSVTTIRETTVLTKYTWRAM